MIDAGGIGRQIQCGENLAEKKPGTKLPGNQIAVLALPADTRPLGDRLFQYRGGIDEDLDLAAAFSDQPLSQLLQASFDQVMIIAMPRIHRDATSIWVAQGAQRVFVGAVVHAEHDDAFDVRPKRLRAHAAIKRALQPNHIAMPPRIEIIPIAPLDPAGQFRFRKSHHVETQPSRPAANLDRPVQRQGLARLRTEPGGDRGL